MVILGVSLNITHIELIFNYAGIDSWNRFSHLPPIHWATDLWI